MDVDHCAGSRPAKRPRLDEGDSDGITQAIINNMAPDSSINQGDMATHHHQEAVSHRQTTCNSNTPKATTSTVACRLLALPAELREQIWVHTVTEWTPAPSDKQDKHASSSQRRSNILEKKPIRMDRLNRPLPPAITRVSHQLRAETLPLYYQENIFECWRPLFWIYEWKVSTLIGWLDSLVGPQSQRKIKWLRHVVLLYKNKDELEYDVVAALFELGYELDDCEFTSKLELSEYEQCFEQMGLPRHFGKKKRYDRWGAAHP